MGRLGPLLAFLLSSSLLTSYVESCHSYVRRSASEEGRREGLNSIAYRGYRKRVDVVEGWH